MNMKKYLTAALLGFAVYAFAAVVAVGSAKADGYDLAVRNTKNFETFTGAASAGDLNVIFDASADRWKTVAAGNSDTLKGRAVITICGDGTTINNNTIYYGPSMVPVASGERTCDITAAGNATEATADAPAFSAAFQVLSMDCLTADPGAAGVTFALRAGAAASVPSVTCTAANTELGCATNVQTTTAITALQPIAIAASSTGNQGATPFACQIHVAY